jgi:hypothetical protein
MCNTDGVLAIEGAGTRTSRVVDSGRRGRGCGYSGVLGIVPDMFESGEALSRSGGGVATVGEEGPDSGTKDSERPRSAGVGGRERERLRFG